jgi:hypothetical protein
VEGHQNRIIRPDQNPFTPLRQTTFALDTKFAETIKLSRQITPDFILLRGNSNYQNLGKVVTDHLCPSSLVTMQPASEGGMQVA